MQHHGNQIAHERCSTADNRADDAKTQRAVLAVVLAEHPSQGTLAELTREIAQDSSEYAQADAVARAVTDLVGVGLTHRSGDLVLPSRAALRFAELEQG